MMIEENVNHLISDSKFLEESCFLLFFGELSTAAKRGLAPPPAVSTPPVVAGNPEGEEDDPVSSEGGKGVKDLESALRDVSIQLPNPTEATLAWFEMVIVEAALRNRDRISLIWPILADHYVQCFALDEDDAKRESAEDDRPILILHSVDRYNFFYVWKSVFDIPLFT
jgi:hypothetical protein